MVVRRSGVSGRRPEEQSIRAGLEGPPHEAESQNNGKLKGRRVFRRERIEGIAPRGNSKDQSQ